ncbi:hypothetical protein CK203_070625 [Vitis vinifera]|uniref:Uncharacterized protein n=1 Tax=Vitis vinifera TaxID=29760 RepID=A0A438C1B0_VITVI|nr:hypothetical protein CK203_070625 [Vitis vinifera]
MEMVENLEEWALEIGYKAGGLLSTYLGLPLSTPFKSMVASNGVKDRAIKLRLEWIQRDFPLEGRGS